VAATNSRASDAFVDWLDERLQERGWSARELSRRSDVAQSQITRWRDGAKPSLKSIRSVCAALGLPAVEGFIAIGYLAPDDIGATITTNVVELREVEDEALVDEISRRFRAYAQRAKDPRDAPNKARPIREGVATNASVAHLQPGEQLAARRDERGNFSPRS
jgi:transcriptional regulator with XRE-family HTH domain